MYALRLEMVIPENRQLVVSLPDDAPTGVAEVIILSMDAQPEGSGVAILHYLRSRPWKPIRRRTSAEIDRQIAEERSAWE